MSDVDYRSSGVDIEGGDAWVGVVKRLIGARGASLQRGGDIGGFSGLYPIGGGRSLAACCDGVGTKIELARQTGLYRGLGVDLVAMSVNDLVTCGASPLFFLDYMACGRLNTPLLAEVMEGILDACSECGCALLGGETAEMPGVYPQEGFDLAGFAVGIVDDARVINGAGITAGDSLIGLPSSGLHSNGFSLVRRVIESEGIELSPELSRELMTPTRLYVRPAELAFSSLAIKGMAHITGGGLEANSERILPQGLCCNIDFGSWERPAIYGIISAAGVQESEMRRVFNLGIGYVFVVNKAEENSLLQLLRDYSPVVIGAVGRKS